MIAVDREATNISSGLASKAGAPTTSSGVVRTGYLLRTWRLLTSGTRLPRASRIYHRALSTEATAMFSAFRKRALTRRALRASVAGRLLSVMTLCAGSGHPVGAQTHDPGHYRIETGDKIAVAVFGQPDLSGEATVDQNGNVRLPVIGDVRAASLTAGELETSIGRSLEQGYVRRPMVTVKIAEFRPIYMLGMVRTPGLYAYREGEPVLAAIARAG